MKNQKKKGFTLVELLVVIAILAILASVSVVGYLGFTEKANKSVDETLCAQYNTLLKAQSVFDDDITLGELVQLIEVNGIRSNQFQTTSRSYEFAYDKPNATVVLLNAGEGTVAYPQNYTPTALWSALDSDQELVNGVNNYALLSSLSINGELKTNGVTGPITIDCGNHALDTTKANFASLDVSAVNGTVIKKDNTIKTDESVKTIDTSVEEGTWGKIYSTDQINPAGTVKENLFPTNYAAVANNEITVDGKYFSAAQLKQGTFSPIIKLDTNVANANTITFENCVFENLGLSITADKNIIIKNCEFINVVYFSISLEQKSTSDVSFEISGNTFSDCMGGINLLLFGNSTNESKIINNTFKIHPIVLGDEPIYKVNHPDQKKNAIQLAASSITDVSNFGKLTISGNKVTNGNALVNVHESIAKRNKFDHVDYEAIFNNNITFANNEAILTKNGLAVPDVDAKDPEGEETKTGWTEYLTKLANILNAKN